MALHQGQCTVCGRRDGVCLNRRVIQRGVPEFTCSVCGHNFHTSSTNGVGHMYQKHGVHDPCVNHFNGNWTHRVPRVVNVAPPALPAIHPPPALPAVHPLLGAVPPQFLVVQPAPPVNDQPQLGQPQPPPLPGALDNDPLDVHVAFRWDRDDDPRVDPYDQWQQRLYR